MSLLGHRPYSFLDNDDDIFQHKRQKKIHRKKLHRCLLWTVIALSGVLAVVILAAVQIAIFAPPKPPDVAVAAAHRDSSAAFDDALVVRTNCGEYIGTIEDGAFVFKGIPYAKAPVGHLRWKKPVAWWSDGQWCGREERQRAHHYARPCFHIDPRTKNPRGTEDCLFLNVWSPRLDTSASLEVLVWFHGGGLQWGSGHETGGCPSGRVAKRLNAVFVSFNYRLGPLGFMALDLLSETPHDARGNYGLWDQITALQWVQHNIRAFGGDPDKVTVLGTDSGAASILALRASTTARNLFHAAWLIGPAVTYNRTFSDASQNNRAFFLARTGCRDSACLRKMSPQSVVDAYLGKDNPSFRVRDQNDLPIQGIYPEQLIVIDGEILHDTPLKMIDEKEGDDMPLLVGTTAQAADAWPGPDDVYKWNWSQLSKYVVTSLDSFGTGTGHEALLHYNTSQYNDFSSAEEVYSSMVSDLRQTCPIDRMCQLLANVSTSALYRYVVVAKPSVPVNILGYPSSHAFHPWDAIAFFDHMEHYMEPTSADFFFRDELHRLVRAFVRSSGKRSPIPGWEPYPHSLAIISSENITMVDNYHEDKCRFWVDKGFEDYAWVS